MTRISTRFLASSALLGLLLLAAPSAPALAQSEQQALVDRATLTAQELLGTAPDARDPRSMLRRARAVMICPQVFKAGFFFAASGGDCVLVARDGAGSWSYPAFYTMGSGSFGFQAGIQDAQLVMMIFTPRGLAAVMDSQLKLGGDASVAIATLGAGVEGSTTADLGADILVFAKNRGLFAGISLQGSLMSARTDFNQAYYGRAMASRQIVIDMQAANPGADPLRATLTELGGPSPVPMAAAQPPGPGQQGANAGIGTSGGPLPLQPAAPGGRAVQQQPLPPPR